jgi:hypothetical protein
VVEHKGAGLGLESERVLVDFSGGEGECVGLLGVVPSCSGLYGVDGL